jgi:ankyrin repeat protein
MKRLLTVLILAGTIPAAAQSPNPSPQDRFWNAAIAGDTIALAKALEDGASVDALDTRTARNGRRALNWAAINNRVDAIRWLLAHGAPIEAVNLTGFTALHHAAEYGSVDATRVLLAAGADAKHTNYDGVTPLARARQEGHVDVAELLEAAERGVRPKN